MMMANADLGGDGAVFENTDLSNSPFGQFLRTTSGKKIYIENKRVGSLPQDGFKKGTKLM